MKKQHTNADLYKQIQDISPEDIEKCLMVLQIAAVKTIYLDVNYKTLSPVNENGEINPRYFNNWKNYCIQLYKGSKTNIEDIDWFTLGEKEEMESHPLYLFFRFVLYNDEPNFVSDDAIDMHKKARQELINAFTEVLNNFKNLESKREEIQKVIDSANELEKGISAYLRGIKQFKSLFTTIADILDTAVIKMKYGIHEKTRKGVIEKKQKELESRNKEAELFYKKGGAPVKEALKKSLESRKQYEAEEIITQKIIDEEEITEITKRKPKPKS